MNRFYSIDPVTEESALADPTSVVFTVNQPDGTSVAYVFGVDVNVTNPSVGLFLCELAAPLPPGIHSWRCEGGGAIVAANEGTFEILESGTIIEGPQSVAEPGPCQPWISAEDVRLACSSVVGGEGDDWKLESAATIGSNTMWELTARKFSGVCERTVRPCRDRCSCFGAGGVFGWGPWWWAGGYGYGFTPYGPGYWINECGDSCGCGHLPVVKLAGYPVREILEVKIDGDVVDPATYRLDRRRELVRLSSFGPPRVDRWWPACQDQTLPDTEPGTFSIRYAWGAQPSELGKAAASQLACEVYKSLSGQDCKLPSRATKIVRQGVTIDRVMSFAQMLRSGSTGLQLVDLFIATENPSGALRRPAVFSPDVSRYGRETLG